MRHALEDVAAYLLAKHVNILQAGVVEASKKALQASMGDPAVFGEMVMKQLVHNHPSPSQNGSGNNR